MAAGAVFCQNRLDVAREVRDLAAIHPGNRRYSVRRTSEGFELVHDGRGRHVAPLVAAYARRHGSRHEVHEALHLFTALPSASSAVKDSALFAGTLKCAEPSSSTFTVPSGRSRLNVPSIVIGSIAPVRWHASGRTSLTSSFFMSELFTEPIFLPIATSIKATVASSAP